MASDDLTLRVLQEIRDAVRGTNERVDETNKRLDETNQRVDRLDASTKTGFADLGRVLKKSEFQMFTEIRETETKLEAIRVRERERDEARRRLDSCERSIFELNQRFAEGGPR